MRQVLTSDIASIASAGFAPLGPTVKPWDPITGALTWKNNGIAQGTYVIAAYAFGWYDPGTGSFQFAGYTHDGKTYIWGSRERPSVPSPGTTETRHIRSYAPEVNQQITFDAFCLIGESVTLGVHGEGGRIIGLLWDDLKVLPLYAAVIARNALTVAP